MTSCSEFCVKNREHEISTYSGYSLVIIGHHYIESHIKEGRCTDCITAVIAKSENYFKDIMKRKNHSLWFDAIVMGRKDVLELFLMYGIERYEDYVCDGYNSYQCLTYCAMNDYHLTLKNFIDIFFLFVAAGIPVDEEAVGHVSRIKTAKNQEDVATEFYKLSTLLLSC